MEACSDGTEVLCTPQKLKEATGVLIMLHGSGANGLDLQEDIRHFLGDKAAFPHIKVLFPTARPIVFTPLGGCRVPSWYNISGFTRESTEDETDIENSYQDLMKIINNEVKNGIPLHRIALAGFSRGGAMCLHLGYRFVKGLAGVCVMSSFLSDSSKVFQELAKKTEDIKYPKLLQIHGAEDSLVPLDVAQSTFKDLIAHSVQGEFKSYQLVAHELNKYIIEDVYNFIHSVLPL